MYARIGCDLAEFVTTPISRATLPNCSNWLVTREITDARTISLQDIALSRVPAQPTRYVSLHVSGTYDYGSLQHFPSPTVSKNCTKERRSWKEIIRKFLFLSQPSEKCAVASGKTTSENTAIEVKPLPGTIIVCIAVQRGLCLQKRETASSGWYPPAKIIVIKLICRSSAFPFLNLESTSLKKQTSKI